jgi:sulfur-oxidizing protein SoxZ
MQASSKIPMRLNFTGMVIPGSTLQAVLLIGHPMESGYRTHDSGQRIPKNVIDSIRVQLNGQLPYLAFPVPLPSMMPASGWLLQVAWVDDSGQRGGIERELK